MGIYLLEDTCVRKDTEKGDNNEKKQYVYKSRIKPQPLRISYPVTMSQYLAPG